MQRCCSCRGHKLVFFLVLFRIVWHWLIDWKIDWCEFIWIWMVIMRGRGIFCDLTTAFDHIDHEILLWKLDFYGFWGLFISTNQAQPVVLQEIFLLLKERIEQSCFTIFSFVSNYGIFWEVVSWDSEKSRLLVHWSSTTPLPIINLLKFLVINTCLIER